MLRAVAAFLLLCSLSSQVNGLITTDARCLTGYQWTFSSLGQSPCDVAAELASVCAGGQFNLDPLGAGYIYAGPTASNQNPCRCSSVYYSLLSACGYCQGRNYLRWSLYGSNCSVVYLKVYNQNLPVGVKVPAYAYQDVSASDTFNITLAQSMAGGVESSRLPQTSSSTPTRPTSGSTSAAAVPSSSTKAHTVNNTPAIIGGVVGGLVALGLIGALITFLVLRSRQKSQQYNRSLIQSISPPPGSPGMVYRGDDRSSYPNMNDPNRNTVVSHITGSSAQNHMPQTMPQHPDGRSHNYSGMPEL